MISQKVTYKPEPQPNFEVEVMVELRRKQKDREALEAQRQKDHEAAEAAKLAAAQSATQSAASIVITPPKVAESGDPALAGLRMCEAGGDYAKNTGNGYYGAYQYDIRTWNNYGGYARPDLAPASVQDSKVKETVAARGWSPWPWCARKLGLL